MTCKAMFPLALAGPILAGGLLLAGCAHQAPATTDGVSASTGAATAAPATNAVRIALIPPADAPVAVTQSLQQMLAATASANGVTLLGANDSSAAYRLKGYLSAVPDGGGTLAVYVWDVTTPDGRRVYRISGRAKANGRPDDPWTAVDSGILMQVAQGTFAALQGWLAQNAG
ncbi:hypothetical protein SAMN05216548_101509 [Faunimonas pinastri]|uniref:Lipoprotein n=1 Tax=Faunimonas pinastri TaxID=1855383 RepID=A0A1H9ARL1_9HYPH|nr:hypothetical protein [Faunimonas pinastri]SEP79424.1 hypothetical protein SAMN05216548_101509 [Faunimonas pinastri]